MAEEKDVRIVAVPQEPLHLRHRFDDSPSMPVNLSFAGTKLPVRLSNGERALSVDMRMLLAARKALPLCLSLCKEICAESDYQISITIFDRPVATIRLRGRTRFSPCDD